MQETARLIDDTGWIDLGFVEREATPRGAMDLGIRLHLAGLSLADTASILGRFGVERHRTTVHTWVKKADLQPAAGCEPTHVALDETVIWINDEQFWLFAAVDPATNRLLHVRLFPTRTTALTSMFLAELREKHHVDEAVFLVDSASWLKAALHRHGLEFRYEKHGLRNSVERVFREVKRRTHQFSNCFSHVNPQTAESWLTAFAAHHNALI